LNAAKYKISDYLFFLKDQLGRDLDENNLEWKKQGYSLLLIDMTHERTFIVYAPSILGHWDFEEGDDYPAVVENHFKHTKRMEGYANVIPFKPPKARWKT